VETDVEFPFIAPAVVGRFDPTVGPIDVDLGALTPEGGYVSRRHARILFEEGVFKVEDLQSSNGTFLMRDDFEKVDSAELVDGTEIAFGNARFVFKIG
jgi:pSer/pThr/pTyr-binding forkhead associated (FHA) protein